MPPSKVRTLYPPGNLREVLFLLSIFILAIFVIALTGRQPAFAQDDTKTIGAVHIESIQPEELELSWDAPTSMPRDYRVSWARVGENLRLGQTSWVMPSRRRLRIRSLVWAEVYAIR